MAANGGIAVIREKGRSGPVPDKSRVQAVSNLMAVLVSEADTRSAPCPKLLLQQSSDTQKVHVSC